MADPVRAAGAAIVAHLDAITDAITANAAEASAFAEAQQRKVERLQAQVGDLTTRLETAERNRERFRYALFVYLQERDGPAGKNAPTNETLALIRDLLENRQVDS